MRDRHLLSLLLAAPMVLAGVLSAAQSISVTTLADVVDTTDLSSLAALEANPGEDGAVSLREAITAANADPPPSGEYRTINFDVAGTVQLIGTTPLTLSANNYVIHGGGDIALNGRNTMPIGLILRGNNCILNGLRIAQCTQSGILIDGGQSNIVTRSLIGVDGGNGQFGIEISNGATGNVIGLGLADTGGNVISGNGEVGIFIYGVGTTGNAVYGNYIGTTASGMQALPNGFNGITIGYGASNNVVGNVDQLGNVISGNGRSGIFLFDTQAGRTTGNSVFNNLIGVGADGTTPLGNGRWGIYAGGGVRNVTIGETLSPGLGNSIAHNGFDGIEVNGSTTTGVRILGNAIFQNAEKGIDLVNGANGGVNPPLLTGSSPISGTAPGAGTVHIYVDSSDEGEVPVISVDTQAAGVFQTTANLAEFVGRNLTATFTDAGGNTSAFSAPLPVGGSNPIFGVTVEVANVDGLASILLNGEVVAQAGDNGVTGPVDVTGLLLPGENIFRFVAAATTGGRPAADFTIRVNGVVIHRASTEDDGGGREIVLLPSYTLAWQANLKPLTVQAKNLENGAPLAGALVRVDELSAIARTDEAGEHVFLVPSPGSYHITAGATGYETQQSPEPLEFAANTVSAGIELFLPRSAASGRDSDGDGLSDWDELYLYETNPENPDTDSDGMSDYFEVLHGLDNTRDDSGEDPDSDGYTNMVEFRLGTDPRDPSQPRSTFFVSVNGNDQNPGTTGAPWRTIGHAVNRVAELLDVIQGPGSTPVGLRDLADGTLVTIRAGVGVFEEDVALVSGVRLQGSGVDDTTIRGSVTMARFSSLLDVRVKEPVQARAVLVDVNTGLVLLHGVKAEGIGAASGATGMRFSGADARTCLVTDCELTRLRIGIEVSGAVPLIRRTRFHGVDTGIVLRATKQGGTEENSLGRAGDASTGWNRFEDIGDKAVVNERDTPIKMQNNDWDTDDPDEVAALIDGPAEFEPFLPKGAGLLPASITCTVWDAATTIRIETANAAASPGGLNPVTDNVDGVYVFAAIPGGNYTITVSAPGFLPQSKAVTVDAGETASVVFPMQEGDAPPPPGGCNCGKMNLQQAQPGALQLGDATLAALVALALLVRRRG